LKDLNAATIQDQNHNNDCRWDRILQGVTNGINYLCRENWSETTFYEWTTINI